MELKNTWEAKLQATKAIEPRPDDVMPAALKQPIQQKPINQLNHGNTICCMCFDLVKLSTWGCFHFKSCVTAIFNYFHL
uniref:Unkown protein n=1 Tax=Riptortus pedestris TaxID=329032 RepID=R4WE01_RIPPE|nr:unkown protein [Riptortus pedestris]